MDALSSSTSYTVSGRARLSTPEPIVALPCGSRSTISTRCPVLARPAARFTVVVVLPTPPFWFATQKMRMGGSRDRARGGIRSVRGQADAEGHEAQAGDTLQP